MIEVRYEVAVQVDPDLWDLNYGLENPLDILQDIRASAGNAIEELVNNWLEKSGNRGKAIVKDKL